MKNTAVGFDKKISGDNSLDNHIDVGKHLLELLVLDLAAEGAHGSLELAELDCARMVGVKQV